MQVTVVIPVHNEKPFWITENLDSRIDEILVVDDGSDKPFQLLEDHSRAAVMRVPTKSGYGSTLKSGIHWAINDWIITMDGDGQHEWEDVSRLIDFVERFPEVDMVIGDRRLKETSFSRYIGRKFLNFTASFFAWRWIPDLNSGLRIFRRKPAMGYFPILCDGFSFTTSLTLSFLADGYKVDFLPIKVQPRTEGLSKVKKWKDGWTTLKYILWIGLALRTRKIRGLLRFSFRQSF